MEDDTNFEPTPTPTPEPKTDISRGTWDWVLDGPAPSPTIKTDISRATQTKWIVGAIAVATLTFLYVATRLPEGARDADCQHFYGMDQKCMSDNALYRLGHMPVY